MTIFPKMLSVFVVALMPFANPQPLHQPSAPENQTQDYHVPTLFEETDASSKHATTSTVVVGSILVLSVVGIVSHKGKGKCLDHNHDNDTKAKK